MPETVILEPLEEEELQEDIEKYKKIFSQVQKKLNDMKDGENCTFEDFLSKLKVNFKEYTKAIQSSLDGPKVFLRRTPNEIRVNPYIISLLKAWQANHDLQFVIDPFACVVYIVNYISKAQRGMSSLLDEACKEARQGNFELRKQVRHMGNKFLNGVEISAQEAAYLTLQLPLTKCTRDCIFINTSPPEERTFLLKQRESLEKLPGNSTEIEADNLMKRYSKRPKVLENWCLADYASELTVIYPKKPEEAERTEVNDDQQPDFEEDSEEKLCITLKSGIQIKHRNVSKIIRYVRYSIKIDSEQHYREKILLFHPWRNEEKDVLGPYGTYEEHYNHLKKNLKPKMEKYERNAEELDEAQEFAENAENIDFSEVAPQNEQTEEEDAEQGSSESRAFVMFDPRRPEKLEHYDIGQDIGVAPEPFDIEINTHKWSNPEYYRNIRLLNKKQREFFIHVLHWIKTKTEPLHAFLTGGAGVGKSVVVRALHQALMRELDTVEGENPDLCRVLLCAPTGKAAYNISGVTIHSAFGIPASQGFHCKPLTSDVLNTLRSKYRCLSVVVIDEVSMVGNSMLKLINDRLQQIFGRRDFFGGIHVILIGDLFQLKPVMDAWIFEDLKNDFGPLATNLWQDLFSVHELTDIMRQKDDLEFAVLLNRLREGNQTKEDLDVLRSRIANSDSNTTRDIPHLFTVNEKVRTYNSKVYDKCKKEKTTVTSMDCFVGGHKELEHKLKRLPENPSKTAGLEHSVSVGVGLKYEITANLGTSDGLTNGTTCTVKFIDRRQPETTRPSIIWVELDEQNAGIEWRQQYRHLYTRGIQRNWTPIFDIRRTFQYFKHTVIRVQFPLRLSSAKTVHKAQGDTVNEIVVDLTTKITVPHIHYVALSRVRNLSGLHVLSLNEKKNICFCKSSGRNEATT